ncbi:MAG TPA: M23 family metallopeptidase [Anaerolineales bacterium]|nr:M23 family metallopeptidase [Anaerolineales bacterium]
MTDKNNDPLTETPDENKPVSNPVEGSAEENGEASGFADFLTRIRTSGAAGIITRVAASILTVLVVALFVFAISRFYMNNVRSAPPADQPAADTSDDAADDDSSTTNVEEVILPEYTVSDGAFFFGEGGVERGAYPDTVVPSRPRSDVDFYEVQQGDNVFSIAEKFDLEPETILWGNYETLQDNPRFLAIGQTLTILPTNGVYYRYSVGESLISIATNFDVSVETIVSYPGNNLDPYDTDPEDPGIADGTWLIIPGGTRELADWGPPGITRDNPASAAYYGSGHCGEVYEGPIGDGVFNWPTPATYLSGYHYSPGIHEAIDIGGAEGNAIWASDSGVVVYSGWSEYGYGNLIVIDHGNGWQTAYAHLQYSSVGCGQAVYRGNTIGALGNTGNSSGAHLHFEMRNSSFGKVNPMDYLIGTP